MAAFSLFFFFIFISRVCPIIAASEPKYLSDFCNQPEFGIFILESDLTERDLPVRLVFSAGYRMNTGVLLWPGNEMFSDKKIFNESALKLLRKGLRATYLMTRNPWCIFWSRTELWSSPPKIKLMQMIILLQTFPINSDYHNSPRFTQSPSWCSRMHYMPELSAWYWLILCSGP